MYHCVAVRGTCTHSNTVAGQLKQDLGAKNTLNCGRQSGFCADYRNLNLQRGLASSIDGFKDKRNRGAKWGTGCKI